MTPLRCTDARRLLGESAAALPIGDAERLRLDAHLAACPACAAERRVVRAVAALGAWEPRGLGPGARDRVWRAIEHATTANAAASASARVVPARAPGAAHGWLRPALAAAALAAATVAIALAAVWTLGPAHAPASAVRVEGAAGAEWSFEGPRAVRLHAGRATFDVAPGGGAFVVHAPTFDVHVVGTVFSVAPDAVEVTEGAVLVTTPSGALLRRVGAGERWSPEPPAGDAAAASATSAAPLPATATATATTTATAPAPAAATATAPATAPATATASATAMAPASASPRALLSRARARLAASDPKGARTVLAELLARKLPATVLAEARTLIADSLRIEGRPADARRAYEGVARDHAGTPAGDNAAFAAAQLACAVSTAGPAACTAALNAYLESYPKGAFAREARERLARTGGAP